MANDHGIAEKITSQRERRSELPNGLLASVLIITNIRNWMTRFTKMTEEELEQAGISLGNSPRIDFPVR